MCSSVRPDSAGTTKQQFIVVQQFPDDLEDQCQGRPQQKTKSKLQVAHLYLKRPSFTRSEEFKRTSFARSEFPKDIDKDDCHLSPNEEFKQPSFGRSEPPKDIVKDGCYGSPNEYVKWPSFTTSKPSKGKDYHRCSSDEDKAHGQLDQKVQDNGKK